jgi:cytoskeleton-associated protein 5
LIQRMTSLLIPYQRCFGTNVIPPSGILKQLPKMFAHTDKNVRSESVLLSHHLYRNIGDALEPWLADLKPVQVKELHDSFEAMDKEGNGKGTFKPERLTRAQQQGDAEEPEAQERRSHAYFRPWIACSPSF